MSPHYMYRYIGRKVDIDVYGVGDGHISLHNVRCNGTEEYILDCPHCKGGLHNCRSANTVAVSCTRKCHRLPTDSHNKK